MGVVELKKGLIGKKKYSQTLFYSSLFYCAALVFLQNWKRVATLNQASLLAPLFPTGFAHFVSLWNILVILTIFYTFSLLLYLI